VLDGVTASARSVAIAGLALFDLDNTLLDRDAAFSRWASTFIDDHGLSRDAQSVIESADDDGLRPRDQFFEVLRSTFYISTSIDDLVDAYRDQYPRCYTVDDATVTAIRRLRDTGWKVGVVTNGPPSQMLKIEATNLVGEFDAICVSSIVGSKKPERRIFEEAARVCNVPLKGWMIGDSPQADIEGGRAAGLATIWMTRGREWDSSSFAPPDAEASIIVEAVSRILG
jgi:HAD superfamily hydrolase (TIGR01549 family)